MSQHISRRSFFDRVSDGIYGAALSSLLCPLVSNAYADQHNNSRAPRLTLGARRSHHRPRSNAVIHLCMQGGPSQVDLFDPKPTLTKFDGKSPPRDLTNNAIFETDRRGSLMKSMFKFKQHGQSGAWVSDLLPHTATMVDELAIVRSMYNVHPNHEPAIYKMQSGQTFPGQPVFGSWISYGLGTENHSLPAYVVLADPVNRLPTNGVENWMSGFLPPIYQGTPMRSKGSPVLNLLPEHQESASITDAKRELLRRLDQLHLQNRPGQPVLDARISNYEMAARMQLEATEALDVSQESSETLEMYGIGDSKTDNFGRRCLLARRLIENGVRFVQLFTTGQMWDNHRSISQSLRTACEHTDKPVAGLLRDLKQRGLLDSTLVLWGGEFGRLPMAQVQSKNQLANAGRDHGPYGFTSWMAGGGVKKGTVYGATDDIGYAAAENRVSIQDWHATILHLMGLDYKSLVFKRDGLDEKLTHQFETRIVHEIIA